VFGYSKEAKIKREQRGDMAPVLEETRRYHIERTLNDSLKNYSKRRLTYFLLGELRDFDLTDLKPTPRPVRKYITHYVVLPLEQRIEDIQMRLHRLKNSPNPDATMLDIKRDIAILKQECIVAEEQHKRDLDGCYLEGYNDGVNSVTLFR